MSTHVSAHTQLTPAWDLPTRLFKWGLVALVVDAWLSDQFGAATPNWHKWNGYTLLTLLVFRVLWGFVGSSTARFTTFFPTPQRVLNYSRAFITGKTPHFLGHNPLGACMILALMTLLFAQAITGLFSADDDMLVIIGPLARTISREAVDTMREWHGFIFTLILTFASIHILTNLAYQFVKKEPLITAMVTGEKPAADYVDVKEFYRASRVRALMCLFIAVMLVAGSITLGASLFSH